jgi:hypothetical protein
MCNACGIKWKRKNNIGKKRKPRPEELPTINLPPRKKPKINYSRLLNNEVDPNQKSVLEGDHNPASNSSMEDFGFEGSDDDDDKSADAAWPDRLRGRERQRPLGKRRRSSRAKEDDEQDYNAAHTMTAFKESSDESEEVEESRGLIDEKFLKVATLELENLQQQQLYQDEITQLRQDAANLREELTRKERAIAAALAFVVPGPMPVTLADLLPSDIVADLQASPANAGEENSSPSSDIAALDSSSQPIPHTPSPGEQPNLPSPQPLLMS